MPLHSNLFRGDRKLEACQVSDPAHLTPGTQGEHVAKVQIALHALDWLVIDPQELRSQTYGPSTAAAVLKYKTKRAIINRAYQRQPDNIVGKMTISRLDQDMCIWQASQVHKGDCTCSPAGASVAPHFHHRDSVDRLSPHERSPQALTNTAGPMGLTSRSVAENRVGRNRTGRPPQLNKWIRIYCSITKKARNEDGYPIERHIERAKDSLFEHGLFLSVEFGSRFADTINFPGSLVLEEDVALLRKASEDTRPEQPAILRVIVCPRSINAPPGETFRGVSIGGRHFQPFVVLNSKVKGIGDEVMIHEMIHAAYPGPVPHDPERHSVFFSTTKTELGDTDRTWLKPERALALSKSFFAV